MPRYDQEAAGFNRANIRWVVVGQRPNPSLYLAEGGDLDRPASYSLMSKGYFWAFAPRPRDFKLPDAPKLDWSFIVKTIFSLYVSCWGMRPSAARRSRAPLRLVLSNSVGRVRFLAGNTRAILPRRCSARRRMRRELWDSGVSLPQSLILDSRRACWRWFSLERGLSLPLRVPEPSRFVRDPALVARPFGASRRRGSLFTVLIPGHVGDPGPKAGQSPERLSDRPRTWAPGSERGLGQDQRDPGRGSTKAN